MMSESVHQQALFEWAARMEEQYPELGLMFHVPNGGARNVVVARKLKAEGVKKGVPDIWLPVSRKLYSGFVGEMKYGRGKTTKEQEWWIARLTEQGYLCCVAYDWEKMSAAILNYLNGM